MSVKLTKEHLDKYLDNPEECPFCGSDNLKAKGASFIDTICSRDITCNNCYEDFREEFVMVGISKDDIEYYQESILVVQDNFLKDAI